MLAGAILGIGGALAALVSGWAELAWPLGIGTGLLASAWLRSPVRTSRTDRAEHDRLDELRDRLREGEDARDPALPPWAFRLLSDDELPVWWRHARPVPDLPSWLTWRPIRAGVWPGPMTDSGLDGLIRALAHRTGP